MSAPDAVRPQDASGAHINPRQRTISLFNYRRSETAPRSGRVVVLLLTVIAVAVFGAWMLVGRIGGA